MATRAVPAPLAKLPNALTLGRLAVIPVFVVGVCTALIYERTKMLAAPMLVHAIYNAAVLGFQWNLMQ